MRSNLWLIFTELKQSKFHFLLIFCISFLLGVGIKLSIQAEYRISQLVSGDRWDADLVILPKGITLSNFKNELVSGVVTELLPEALFDTTVQLSKNQFKLTAVLALPGDQGSKIMTKSNFITIGLNWATQKNKLIEWQEQNKYSTAEWGNKVIAGFFASGSDVMMKNLKELIDRKTVGQAFYIKDQLEHDKNLQKQLSTALFIFSGILFALIVLAFLSLVLWINIRVKNSIKVFQEIGVSRFKIAHMIIGLIAISVIAPLVFGWVGAYFLEVILKTNLIL